MMDFIDGGVYVFLTKEGYALAAGEFGFHECDCVEMQPFSNDLNQAWRLHQTKTGTWMFENMSAGLFMLLRPLRQFNHAPLIVGKPAWGGYRFEETEDGVRISIMPVRMRSTGKIVSNGPWMPVTEGEGTVFYPRLIDNGKKKYPRMLLIRGDTYETGVPEVMKDGEDYYLVCDRRSDEGIARIGIKHAKKLNKWENYDELLPLTSPRPFEWMEKMDPECLIWCPGIAKFGGKYHIYYAITRQFKNTSAICQLTNVTMDKTSPDYSWKDEGPVIISREDSDFNAIDPHVIRTFDNEIWMVYGSSWTGIKTRKLDESTGKPADDKVYSLCYREEIPHPAEGGYLFKRDGWYYLIAAVERMDQNYRCVIGRSRNVYGPYLDKNGVDMMKEGGSTLSIVKRGLVHPAHDAVLQEGDQYYLIMENQSTRCLSVDLAISTMVWTEDGWPVAASGEEVLKQI